MSIWTRPASSPSSTRPDATGSDPPSTGVLSRARGQQRASSRVRLTKSALVTSLIAHRGRAVSRTRHGRTDIDPVIGTHRCAPAWRPSRRESSKQRKVTNTCSADSAAVAQHSTAHDIPVRRTRRRATTPAHHHQRVTVDRPLTAVPPPATRPMAAVLSRVDRP